jgi:hypothetical protein
MTVVGSWEPAIGRPYNVEIAGSYAYVADWYGGLHILDLSDPELPQAIGYLWLPGPTCDVSVADEYAYASCGEAGLRIVDIGDLASPIQLATVDTPGHAWSIALAGSFAHVADGDAGLTVLDISDPASPELLGRVDTPGDARDVIVSADYVYIADSCGGLQVVDVSDPVAPTLIGSIGASRPRGVVTDGDLIYVADEQDGLWIAWRQCDEIVAIDDNPEEAISDEDIPTKELRLDIHPNPFNPLTTISFLLERNEWASAEVYDLAGRRVDQVADRVFTAGPHTLTWNGRDSQGRAIPSGTYIVRLETDSGVEARKVSLVR